MTPFQYERTTFTNDESCPDIDPDYFNKVEEGFKDAEVSINELNEFAEDTTNHLETSDAAIAANSAALESAQNEIAVLDSFKEFDPDFSYDKYWPCFYDGIPYRSLHDDNVGPNNIPPDTIGTHWEVVGGGSGAGNVGYNFTGGQMDNGVAMYTGYKDAAQATPVDGTGGTVTTGHTFAKNTTEPIIGIADALWSKPAANCQGEGYSCPFSIDEGRRSGPTQITFDYKTLEGYIDSDAGAYVYDVDNGAILPISANLIPSTNQRAAQFIASFIPSSSKNYRLCFHVASTSSTVWGMRIDNIVIEGKRITQGAAGGGWKDFVPGANISNLPGSWSIARYRRNLENIDLFLTYAASGAATGVISILANDLLSSLGLTTNQQSMTIPGAVGYNPTGSVFFNGMWNPITGIFRGPDISTWTTTAPFTWATGSQINIIVSLQISQLTGSGTVGLVENYEEYVSNSDVSSTASVTGSGFLQGFGQFGGFGSGWAVGTVWTRRVKLQQPYQPGRDTITVGLRLPSTGQTWDDAANSGYIQRYIQIYNTTYGFSWEPVAGDSYLIDVKFYAGGRKSSGATIGANGLPFSDLNGFEWFVKKVSAGKPGQELPTVRAEVENSSARPGSAYLLFSSKIEDTNSCFSTATGVFTPCIGGLLRIFGNVLNSTTATCTLYVVVKRGGTTVRTKIAGETRVASSRIIFNTSVRVKAGDEVALYCDQGTAASATAGVTFELGGI